MWLPLLVVAALIFLYRWNRQRQTLQNLTDKYVLITGCDSGFGNLAAKQLDAKGLHILAACLTEKGAMDLKKKASSRLQTVILDVTDSQKVSAVAEWVANTLGNKGLWGLVNNAGFAFALAPNEWQRKEDFIMALNVNLLGTINMTLHLLPLLRQTGGRIVNVSSALGRLSCVGGGYCISKFGVEAFSDSLRRELDFFGIKVSIIEPGAFVTSMTDFELHKKNLRRLWEDLPIEVKENYGELYYQQYMQSMERLMGSASKRLHEVTDCMEHALTAIYPWTRYSPGLDSKLFFIPLSYLPTVVSDYVLRLFTPKSQ
ncbi:retinol dehydrogenase 7 [Xenopus tropicalis]|nr:retinol dehydrogenase 7 [Xenopus tropicalis]|eukprot:XP_017947370.1 PREDICTED: retinol dehydrogenase 3-like [Xenopus tropicalis]